MDVIEVEKHLACRVLYPNPVCILTTSAPDGRRNCMTISWLTALNSSNICICVMNLNRHSYTIVKDVQRFVLNVPTSDFENLVLKVGSCHGGDKFSQFNIETCNPGWGTYKPSNKARRKKEIWIENPGIGLRDCVAHLQISVLSTQIDHKHAIMTCSIDHAFVKTNYWSGKQFIQQDPSLPPILTFLGTQVFGYVHPDIKPAFDTNLSSNNEISEVVVDTIERTDISLSIVTSFIFATIAGFFGFASGYFWKRTRWRFM